MSIGAIALPEDLGLKTRSSASRPMLGQDYMTARDQLIDAYAKAGAGLLIHPYLGRLTVICTGCQVSEHEEGGLARIHPSFVDPGENTIRGGQRHRPHRRFARDHALSAAETSFASTLT